MDECLFLQLVALNSWSWNKMEKTINTIVIQVAKLADKKADNADNISILNEMKCAYNNQNSGLMSKITQTLNKLV